MAILSGLFGSLDRVARGLSDFADMLAGLTQTGRELNEALRAKLDLDGSTPPLLEARNNNGKTTEARKTRV